MVLILFINIWMRFLHIVQYSLIIRAANSMDPLDTNIRLRLYAASLFNEKVLSSSFLLFRSCYKI